MPSVWLVVAGALAPPAWAHKASDAYLRVSDVAASNGQSPSGAVGLQLSLALKDVDAALELLDADGDRKLTWGEIRQATPAVAQWASAGVQWQCGDVVTPLAWRFEALEQRTDGRYIRFASALDCPAAKTLALTYRLMQGIDPTHRLLVSGELNQQPLAAALAPDGRSSSDLRTARLGDSSGVLSPQTSSTTRGGFATMLHFVTEGVHHILEGYDHLAFLLALLLPISLLQRRRSTRKDAAGFFSESPEKAHQSGIKTLLITVTSFTLGHSVTLVLAGLGWVTVSGNWVEPAIAISIGISALLNLFPVKGLQSVWLALGFGLVHGLGFSGVLVEAGVSGTLLVWALAGFNLGVEAGQLMVVALWCAVSVVLVRWSLYHTVVVRGGSVALLVLSLYWTVQRIASSG
ncbi:MAG: HupE/UreJ family protein [Acidovorax sp.]|uniref:HupE/UreJ family protein n=1 Tax=Acidovorax sp. TaxID=1872122 RepID=UPI00391DB59A